MKDGEWQFGAKEITYEEADLTLSFEGSGNLLDSLIMPVSETGNLVISSGYRNGLSVRDDITEKPSGCEYWGREERQDD